MTAIEFAQSGSTGFMQRKVHGNHTSIRIPSAALTWPIAYSGSRNAVGDAGKRPAVFDPSRYSFHGCHSVLRASGGDNRPQFLASLLVVHSTRSANARVA